MMKRHDNSNLLLRHYFLKRKKVRHFFVKILLCSIVGFLSHSCLTITTVQSGKTLGEGNSEIILVSSYGVYSPTTILRDSSEFDYKPSFAVKANMGIKENIEITSTDHYDLYGKVVK
ncbi:MAG: hypothetical protein ACLGGV_04825 [Bacteroidia bacterium]